LLSGAHKGFDLFVKFVEINSLFQVLLKVDKIKIKGGASNTKNKTEHKRKWQQIACNLSKMACIVHTLNKHQLEFSNPEVRPSVKT
jgi:hypothetical protein